MFCIANLFRRRPSVILFYGLCNPIYVSVEVAVSLGRLRHPGSSSTVGVEACYVRCEVLLATKIVGVMQHDSCCINLHIKTSHIKANFTNRAGKLGVS